MATNSEIKYYGRIRSNSKSNQHYRVISARDFGNCRRVFDAVSRVSKSAQKFISDGALMMIALACYIFAALFQLTNLYAPSEMAQKIGLWSATLGVFFNFSSWLVRWVGAYDREIAMTARKRKYGNAVVFPLYSVREFV